MKIASSEHFGLLALCLDVRRDEGKNWWRSNIVNHRRGQPIKVTLATTKASANKPWLCRCFFKALTWGCLGNPLRLRGSFCKYVHTKRDFDWYNMFTPLHTTHVSDLCNLHILQVQKYVYIYIMQCKFGICCFLWNASYSLKCYIQKRFTEHLPLPSTGWRKSMSRRSTMPCRSFTCGDWMVSWNAVDPRLLNFTSWSNKQIRSAERISICCFSNGKFKRAQSYLKKNIRRPCKTQ